MILLLVGCNSSFFQPKEHCEMQCIKYEMASVTECSSNAGSALLGATLFGTLGLVGGALLPEQRCATMNHKLCEKYETICKPNPEYKE